MYELNNTVYVTTQNTHLRLSNENLVVEPPDQPMRHVPLHHLTAIVRGVGGRVVRVGAGVGGVRGGLFGMGCGACGVRCWA